jgi:hypothetical protein
MAQVGPLRECQDIMGPASAFLVIIWSLSGGSFDLPVFLVSLRIIAVVACFSAGGILFHLSGTLFGNKLAVVRRAGTTRSLWQHLEKEHAQDERKVHACPSCTFRALTSTALTIHQVQNLRLQPYIACSCCKCSLFVYCTFVDTRNRYVAWDAA